MNSRRVEMLEPRKIGALVAMLGFALVGCKSDDVQMGVSHDPLTPFPARATFAWNERANSFPRERLGALNLEPLILEVVEEEFADRGYRRAEAGETPQFVLSYQASVDTRIRPESSIAIVSFSLKLDDAPSGRRVWVGFVRAEFIANATREERKERFGRTMRRLLESFPPGQRGS